MEELCAIAGLEPSRLYDYETTYPASVVKTLLKKAVEHSGDEYFWLKAARPELVSTNNLFLYILFQAKTFSEFMLRAERLYNYFTDELAPTHRMMDDHYIYQANFYNPEPEVSPYRVDWWFAISTLYSTLFAGEQYKMTEIHLSAPFNDRADIYEEFFQTPVLINQPQLAFCSPLSNLDLPNIRNPHDPHLEQLLMHQLHSHMQCSSPSATFLQKIHEVLRQQLPNGTPNLDSVASQLAMSSRSLQRKLADEGSSFNEQVRLLRSELATHYLKQQELSISQIAYLLGFQDNRSLTVAFRKWFGMTPSEYRQKNTVPEHENA